MKPYLACLSTCYIEALVILPEGSITKRESRTPCDWILLNLLNLCSNISILFQILVTMYKKIRKSQEILGNQDSGIP